VALFGGAGRPGEPPPPPPPAWAKQLQQRLRQRSVNTFIVTGPGVRDLHPLGERRYGAILWVRPKDVAKAARALRAR